MGQLHSKQFLSGLYFVYCMFILFWQSLGYLARLKVVFNIKFGALQAQNQVKNRKGSAKSRIFHAW